MSLTQDELAAVPHGTVVRCSDGTIAARYDDTRGVTFGDERPFPWAVLRAPAVQLWPQPEVASTGVPIMSASGRLAAVVHLPRPVGRMAIEHVRGTDD